MAILYPETGCWLNTPLQYVTNGMERCRDTAKDTGQSNSYLRSTVSISFFKRTDCPGFSNGDWNFTPYFRPDISYGLLTYRTTAESGS